MTVLVGPNAAGKTNLLEAIHVAATGLTFRKADRADLVRWGSECGTVLLAGEQEGTLAEILLETQAGGARCWTVNGKRRRTKPTSLKVVAFTPDHLALAKGPPETRRGALDAVGAMLSEGYAKAAQEYGRVLRQRNSLLREGSVAGEGLRVWTLALADHGSRLIELRRRLLARLAPAVANAFAGIADEHLEVGYSSRACPIPLGEAGSREEVARALVSEMEARAAEERARGTTLAGPHRDDVALILGERDARTCASQGQQRSLVLAWKLAEATVIRDTTGVRPTMLLDDVMSELDESRRHALGVLMAAGEQSFVTTTNLGYFEAGLLAGTTVAQVGADG